MTSFKNVVVKQKLTLLDIMHSVEVAFNNDALKLKTFSTKKLCACCIILYLLEQCILDFKMTFSVFIEYFSVAQLLLLSLVVQVFRKSLCT